MPMTVRGLARVAVRLAIGASLLLVLVITCFVVFPGAMFVFFMGLIGFANPSWPSISDANSLVAECSSLVDRVTRGELKNERMRTEKSPLVLTTIPPEYWPPHVREIQPISVYVDQESCSLMISTGGINPAWGYGVYPKPDARMPVPCDDPPHCGDNYIRPTRDARVFKWEGFEG